MAGKMTKNGFGVVIVSVFRAVMAILVMLPTLLIQWLTGTTSAQLPSRKTMSKNGQPANEYSGAPLSDNEVELLKASWEILAEDKKTNGVKFFMKLFTMYPDTKKMFKSFKDVPLELLDYDGTTTKKNKTMIAHATSVMYALESYIDSLDDLDCLEELVKKVAISHKPRGIGPAEFKLLEKVFLAVIEDLVKDDSLDLEKIKNAWKELIRLVCSIVKEAQNDN
ncbi:globin-like [Ylistrum balloti]|uniref:globin-like n=1 Tax=Ylistrum balloti TaxID=509963 RepID=UPI002905B73B|nr:globin-like [Ylistrum balloti]